MNREWQAGDIVFAHSTGIIGRAIRLGERLRFHKDAIWNHCAILDRSENGIWFVIQAEAAGVTNNKTLDSVAPYGNIAIVPPPENVNVAKLLMFARAQVGSAYGFTTIATLVFDILTPNWFPLVRRKNSWICSAVTAESLRFGGWLRNWDDIYIVTPAQLWTAFDL